MSRDRANAELPNLGEHLSRGCKGRSFRDHAMETSSWTRSTNSPDFDKQLLVAPSIRFAPRHLPSPVFNQRDVQRPGFRYESRRYRGCFRDARSKRWLRDEAQRTFLRLDEETAATSHAYCC